MGTFYSPKVVTRGLVSCIDFANPKTIVSASSCVDLTTSDTGTLVNSPSVSSGSITLNGVNQFFCSPRLSALFSGTDITEDIWFYPIIDNCVVLDEVSAVIGPTWHASHIELVSASVYFRVWSISNFSGGLCSLNSWNHAVLTYDSSINTLNGWVNGVKSANSVVAARSAPGGFGYDTFYAAGPSETTKIGSGAYFAGKIGAMKIYNRRLTDAEVIQNFQALRGRFGI